MSINVNFKVRSETSWSEGDLHNRKHCVWYCEHLCGCIVAVAQINPCPPCSVPDVGGSGSRCARIARQSVDWDACAASALAAAWRKPALLYQAPLYQAAAAVAEVHMLKPRNHSKIPIVWIRHNAVLRAFGGQPAPESESQSRIVLLHCHGNATDVGMMMGPYMELSKLLGVDVVGVEYSGYGASSPDLHTTHLATDVEAAYRFLLEQGVPATKIVAYGQSIGSSPVTRLAAKHQLGGLILHSPLASGLKVVEREGQSACCRPSCVISCFDVFTNDRYILKVLS
eukprot:5736049-Amphidinium_carterae.3